MNPSPITVYGCPICGDQYRSESRAEECCRPEATEIAAWQCSECLDAYEDREQAHLCCWDGETELEPLLPTPQQLEAAGQQRLPL